MSPLSTGKAPFHSNSLSMNNTNPVPVSLKATSGLILAAFRKNRKQGTLPHPLQGSCVLRTQGTGRGGGGLGNI